MNTHQKLQLALWMIPMWIGPALFLTLGAAPAQPEANAGWTEIGTGSASGAGISNDQGHAANPSMAITATGTPIIAWSASGEIYVRRWDGANWVEMGAGSASGGGISQNGGVSGWPSLTLMPDGSPIIAWEDDSDGDRDIFLRRWNGSSWVEMGGSASGGGISQNGGESRWPSLRVSAAGVPYVAWEDTSGGNREIFVRRWNGTAWVEVGSGSASGGGISNDSTGSRRPSLGIDATGDLFIAWENIDGTSHDIFVQRWNGSAWVEMGAGSANGGGISNDIAQSFWPSLAVPPDGKPVVVCGSDPTGNGMDEIFVRRWNGSNWVEMGSGSASGSGISGTSGESWFASLAIAADGHPVIAWQDNSAGDEEIYFRRWNGSAWIEMDAGSASGGGVSNDGDGEYSLYPSVAASATGMLAITWQNLPESGLADIYVRRYGSPTTPCYTLARTHTGEGSDPTAAPPNSPGCAAGKYIAGQAITLTAAPANGWRVSGWTGTINNTSTEPTNTVTMPAADHAASVIYARVPTCYTLARTHTGEGSDPTAAPPNSPGCAAGKYIAGQAITLTAAPASGWRVSSWAGTTNNASTELTNTVTMPAADHTASVAYVRIPATLRKLFLPSVINIPQVCFAGPWEVEPNNSPATANGPLCAGVTYLGLPNDTFDMFRLETTRAGTLAITVRNHYGSGVQLALFYQECCNATSRVAIDPDQSNGLMVSYAGAPAGQYYIVLYTETPRPTETRPYTLDMNLP